MAETMKYCRDCRHVRRRAPITLFDAADAHSAGVLKAQVEWDQERKQRAQVEFQRNLNRQPFEYEPHNYEWCACFSRIDLVRKAQGGDASALQTLMDEGGATMNPVTGEIGPLYILCAWKNEDGHCAQFESR